MISNSLFTVNMACPVKYPMRQPPNWVPPIPRWQLRLPSDVEKVYTLYVGIQQHERTPAFDSAIASIESWLRRMQPSVIDAFVTEEESAHDIPGGRVWVCYWTNTQSFNQAVDRLSLVETWHDLGSEKDSIGLWYEYLSVPVERLETNYAGLHESPGVSRLPGAERDRHSMSAYWGAARDRIPGSREDLFAVPGTDVPNPEIKVDDEEGKKTDGTDKKRKHPSEKLGVETRVGDVLPPEVVPKGFGQRLTGSSYDNMVHIRSGQCWEHCPPGEAEAYESKLQKSLMKGMQHLWDNPLETGTLGLRWLRNIVDGETINETCGAGFFRNLRDLEIWTEKSEPHLEIFRGAHQHARDWGDGRKFMTWHEVSVVKEGEAKWEYVNCDPKTGVIRFVKMGNVEKL